MSKIQIGDVIVTPWDCNNPYQKNPPVSYQGPERIAALRAFKNGKLSEGLQVWHAPGGGGAKRLKNPKLVDWKTSGIDSDQDEFKKAAQKIGRIVGQVINSWPKATEHPYEKQGILEELIKVLEAAV